MTRFGMQKRTDGSIFPAGVASQDPQGHIDPLASVTAPAAFETTEERSDRMTRELDDKARSDAIDTMLQEEAKERKRLAKQCAELEILLLGPANAGKSTLVRQLRLAYDTKGLDTEREACRLVILLNIVQSTRALLSLLESTTFAQPTLSRAASFEHGSPFQPLSPIAREGLDEPRSEQEAIYRHRIRLAPLLGLEAQLRQALGCLASGPSAGSINGHATSYAGLSDDVENLGWTAATPISASDGMSPLRASISIEQGSTTGRPAAEKALSAQSQKNANRSRNAHATGVDLEPLCAPGFAKKIGKLALGSGKESRRFRAQTSTSQASSLSSDSAYEAGPDDPIHLLAALKDEIHEVYREAISRGLLAGEGTRETSEGGFELSESAKYFIASLDRIAQPHWLPSDDDLLNVRIRTLGIEVHHLQITPRSVYKICDVAGVQGVKHAWAPYFDSAAAVIFITAVSDYSVADPRDSRQNRLADALELFADIATNPLLKDVTMLVFLNKTDLFRKKVKSGLYPFDKFFPGYTPPTILPGQKISTTGHVLNYVQDMFEKRHDGRSKPLYVYCTQANDTKSIRFVIAAVGDILVRETLTSSGLL